MWIMDMDVDMDELPCAFLYRPFSSLALPCLAFLPTPPSPTPRNGKEEMGMDALLRETPVARCAKSK